MDTIIAATDFSKASQNASKYAAALSAELHAQLILVHVIELPLTPLQVPLTVVEFDEIEKSVASQLDELKEQLLFYTSERINILTKIKYGFAETALEDICEKTNPLAVVVGLNSNPSSARFFLGSTALRIIPYLQSPVLIIPEKAVFSGIRNIAIASDSEHIRENNTITSIKKWLSSFHVQPDIVHVATEDDNVLKALSGNVIIHNRFSEFSPKFHSIQNNNVEAGISEFLEDKKPDLLIVVPGKYNFFKKIFHFSHSKQLALRSNLPVLSVPSHGLRPTKKENETMHANGPQACASCDGLCCKDKQASEKQVEQANKTI